MMDVFGFLNLNELALGLAQISLFPFFDMAHYIVSVMSLREQPGKRSEKSNNFNVFQSVHVCACTCSEKLLCAVTLSDYLHLT